MKKSILFFVLLVVLVVSLLIVGCERSATKEVVVATQDPDVKLLATRVAEIKMATQDPAISVLATQVGNLQSSLEDLKSQPTMAVVETAEPITAVAIDTEGNWDKVQLFEGATEEMKSWKVADLNPTLWPKFPNVDNDVWKASQVGVEYGQELDTFCQQDEKCNFVVAALHYRLYTGDYEFEGFECLSDGITGCALVVYNVGNETVVFEDETFFSGFTVTGRYWDGNYIPASIWALMSHVANTMLNMDSDLNPTKITNAGANCSSPDGCQSVNSRFIIVSGEEILMVGEDTIDK